MNDEQTTIISQNKDAPINIDMPEAHKFETFDFSGEKFTREQVESKIKEHFKSSEWRNVNVQFTKMNNNDVEAVDKIQMTTLVGQDQGTISELTLIGVFDKQNYTSKELTNKLIKLINEILSYSTSAAENKRTAFAYTINDLPIFPKGNSFTDLDAHRRQVT